MALLTSRKPCLVLFPWGPPTLSAYNSTYSVKFTLYWCYYVNLIISPTRLWFSNIIDLFWPCTLLQCLVQSPLPVLEEYISSSLKKWTPWVVPGQRAHPSLPTHTISQLSQEAQGTPWSFLFSPHSLPSYLCSVYGWIFCTMMSESSTPRRTPIWRMNIPFSLSVSWLTLTSKMISTRLFFLGSGKHVHQSWL